MKLLPSERARQRSNRRTVRVFFGVMAVLTLAVAAVIAFHRFWSA